MSDTAPESSPGDEAERSSADEAERSPARLRRLEAAQREQLRAALKPVAIIVLSCVVGWIVVGFVGAVDWGQVASAFGRLSAWQVVPLVVTLLVRQLLNAVPLSQFVSGLSVGRSMQNDVVANLAGTVAPPPGDVVVRIAMFNSWGINPLDGMAGVALNMMTFYCVRLLAPAVGLVMLAVAGYEAGNVMVAILLALLGVAMMAALLLLLRAETWASLLGQSAARVVRRFKADVDPQVWVKAVVDFRGRMAGDLPPRLARSMVALLGMIVADASILLLALRFTGVDVESLSIALVLGTFLTAYPLTIMPLFGLGVLDASLIAAFTAAAGIASEPIIVAALAIWRATTLLGALALGGVATLYWKGRTRQDSAGANGADEAARP